jgi:hypothetical protein
MMDVMKAAFDEALKRQKDKRVKLEITFGGEEEETQDPSKKSPDLAPEVKDAKGPEDESQEAEEASVLEQMPESVGREPVSLDEKAAAQFKKKLAEKKK